MVISSGVTSTSWMLSVLSDSSVSVGDVSSELSALSVSVGLGQG